MAANVQINGEEQALWSEFVEGDDKGLEKLYRKYFDELHAFGVRWLNDTHLAEDAIQDLFIKLLNNRKNLSVPANVRYYLFRAFRTNVLDKLRATNRRPVTEIGEGQDFHLELNLDQHLIKSEEEAGKARLLQNALNALTSRQREAIYLKYIKGIPYQEIAMMMELTDKGTYKLMARAIQALKENIPGVMTISIGLLLNFFIES